MLINNDKGDPTTSSAYRLLCMLDTAGKLLKRMLKSRLEKSIEDVEGFSNR